MRLITLPQAEKLLALRAGYVTVSQKDPYATLRAKGLVEDSTTYERGNVEYERTNGKALPRVTREGHDALRAYVAASGRVEFEMRAPMADYTTIVRMTPADVAPSSQGRSS